MASREKEHINVVFIGHVDHGKSTILGRTFYDLGLVKDLPEEAGSFKFAWLCDKLKEERERGLTIDLFHTKLETKKYLITIIDCPGHRDFVKNMITGASQADAAVLVVSAKTGEGVQEQTREHVFLAKTLGVNQMIVAINKMDTVNYSRERFEEVKRDVEALLKRVGYRVEQIPFIPVSGWEGDNVVKRSERMPWYKGPTLYEAFDLLKPPEKPVDKPLRIPVQDVYSITGVGTVPVGRVETGVLKVGDIVVFEPAGKKGEVKSIEMHHQPIKEAYPGDNIGFNVKGIARKELRRGDVAGHPDKPPTVVEEFTGQIIVLNHPTAIAEGYTPVFHAHTAHAPVRFEKLLKKIDPRTGAVVEENPSYIKKGEAAIVKFRPLKPLVLEKYREIPQLGRFAIRDMGITVGAGIVIDLVPKKRAA